MTKMSIVSLFIYLGAVDLDKELFPGMYAITTVVLLNFTNASYPTLPV